MAWLQTHPEALLHHRETLRILELPHDCGEATSLIERQVRVLREDNAQLRERLDELLSVARHNDATAERLHELTLELLGTEDFDGAVSSLRGGLRDGFRADAVGLVLTTETEAGNGSQPDGVSFLTADDPALQPFNSLLATCSPACGVHAQAAQQTLFGDAAGQVASAAWIPLVSDRPWGVLGIGSRDADRFHSGQGTVFLRRMGALVGRILADRLRRG